MTRGWPKREQVAWCVLALSFLSCAVLCAVFHQELWTYLNENTRTALISRAGKLDKAGRYSEAEPLYKKLLKRYPHHEEVLLSYGKHLEQRGLDDRAEEMYRWAAETGRQRFSAIRIYAEFLNRQGRPDDATALYGDYLTRFPSDLTAQLDLGRRLLAQGRLEDAAHHLKAASENPQLRFDAESLLGRAYYLLGDMENAVTAWRRVVGMGRAAEVAVYWQDLAKAYEALEQWDKAAEAWREYVESFPDSLYGSRRLAQIYSRLGEKDLLSDLELRIDALEPPVPLGERISTGRVVIEGASEPEGPYRVGSHIVLDLYFRFLGNVQAGREPRPHFLLRPAPDPKNENLRRLDSAPGRVGRGPFWRGDGARRRFALRIPHDIVPGTYDVFVSFATDAGERARLWSVNVVNGGADTGEKH